ncbi:mis18-binding protein 1 [Aulostomus maculatus]
MAQAAQLTELSSRLESTDSHSDTDPAEDVRPPAVSSQPVLLEDPLVLNTPQISIPKKHKALINHNQWPQHTTLPSQESVIYLKKWYLRRNSSGLFVGGLHREENIPWNSNIIVERVSTTVLKTVSSRVYILVGKMKFVESEFPRWFLKKFENGFPPNWKELNEKFQSESRQKPRRDRESNRQMRRVMARTSLDSSALKTPIRQSRRNTPQTRVSCPAATSSSTRVSRSGRVIKPPLEYWKGGRVILDAHMNVTIFEGYDTSICLPDVTSKVSTRASLDSAQVPQPCSKGRKQRESTSSNEPPAPLRKAKAPPRKRKPAKVLLDQRPSISPGTSSPEETSVDPQTPSEAPEKPSIRKSQRKTKKPWLGEQKRIVPPCNESSTDNDKILQHQSSDEEFSVKKKKRGTKALGMQGRKFSPSSQSSGGSGQKPRKTAKVPKKNNAAQTKPKQSKYTKKSSPPKPSLKVTQSSKKHKGNKVKTVTSKEEDEDQWSEAELNTLQQAVSSFPKHIIGYWTNVARMVGTHSAEECHNKHMSHGTDQTPVKKNDKTKRNLAKAPKEADLPVISARVGTLRRKQQVRQFLEAMPRDDVEDVFSSAQNKCFEIPSMCPSEECDFTLSDLEPMKTPTSSLYPEAKTPRCLHITPGMMGSPDRMTDDRYVFQLQKRMKKRRFNVYKQAPPKSFTPTPSAKQTTKRCGNTESDTFVVWEMFPDKAGMLSESGEEEDFYFSDHD